MVLQLPQMLKSPFFGSLTIREWHHVPRSYIKFPDHTKEVSQQTGTAVLTSAFGPSTCRELTPGALTLVIALWVLSQVRRLGEPHRLKRSGPRNDTTNIRPVCKDFTDVIYIYFQEF